jgi:hypothetical protein
LKATNAAFTQPSAWCSCGLYGENYAARVGTAVASFHHPPFWLARQGQSFAIAADGIETHDGRRGQAVLAEVRLPLPRRRADTTPQTKVFWFFFSKKNILPS